MNKDNLKKVKEYFLDNNAVNIDFSINKDKLYKDLDLYKNEIDYLINKKYIILDNNKYYFNLKKNDNKKIIIGIIILIIILIIIGYFIFNKKEEIVIKTNYASFIEYNIDSSICYQEETDTGFRIILNDKTGFINVKEYDLGFTIEDLDTFKENLDYSVKNNFGNYSNSDIYVTKNDYNVYYYMIENSSINEVLYFVSSTDKYILMDVNYKDNNEINNIALELLDSLKFKD